MHGANTQPSIHKIASEHSINNERASNQKSKIHSSCEMEDFDEALRHLVSGVLHFGGVLYLTPKQNLTNIFVLSDGQSRGLGKIILQKDMSFRRFLAKKSRHKENNLDKK